MDALDADGGKHAFVLVFCPHCGAGSLEDPPSDEQLAGYYRTDYFGLQRRKFLAPVQWFFDIGKRRLARAVLSSLPRGAVPRVLDVGCGTGQLLVELERLGAVAIGTERAGAASRTVRPGLLVLEGELDDCLPGIGRVDAIVIWHVLEHLRDPAAALQTARGLLPPDGLLFVAVPNSASWQARLFGRYWFHLDVPRHLHFLTRQGLVSALQSQGFVSEHVGTLQWSQALFGFIQSALNVAAPGRPNRLYRLLREPLRPSGLAELALWSLAASLLLPLAVIETVASAALGAGAVCVIRARKA
ncbi:MAG: class I SAM-dependent methyltransferase [Gammaproteobacteria bacterium]